MYKNLNFTQALFLMAVYLKASSDGLGASMSWFDVFIPLVVWFVWVAIDLVLRVFGVTDRLEAWFVTKLTKVVAWKRKRELINEFKKKK